MGLFEQGGAVEVGVAGGVVIDLGEDWSARDDRRARPARPGRLRLFAGALVVALTATLSGAGAPATGATCVLLADVPFTAAGVIAFGPQRAYLADRLDSLVDGRTWHGVVAMYPLPGRSPGWRTPVPEVPQQLTAVPGAGVLVGVTFEVGAGAVRMMVLDAGSGRLLWTSTSATFAHAPAGSAEGLLFDDTIAGPVARWADVRTGRTLWTHAVPPGGTVFQLYGASLADPAWLVMIGADGVHELVAEQTGATFTSALFDDPRPAGDQSGTAPDALLPRASSRLAVVGDRVLVLRTSDQGQATLTAVGLAALTQQWTLTGDFDVGPYGCGPLLCLEGGEGLTAVEPATGAVVWRAGGWHAGQPVDGEYLLAHDDPDDSTLGLLDVATGRVLTRVSGWTPVFDSEIGLTRLVVRPDTRQQGRVWFAIIDARTPAPSVLGSLSGLLSTDCQSSGDLVACRTRHRTVQIWRLGS